MSHLSGDHTPPPDSGAAHLYVHIPFCHHLCPYCGFYKHRPGKLANQAFVEALLTETELRRPALSGAVETVYFGGGTPSLLSRSHLERLCSGLADRLPLDQVTEWTVEANPATFDRKKAERMREMGVNRISLGVQSFQPETLRTLGRDHTPEEAIEAFHNLREAGFSNISVDLMFSIPGQTRGGWEADLEQTLALKPEHISAYNLTYEEDTDFLDRHRSGELDIDENRDAELFREAITRLAAAGFEHYEISNHARPGFESRHNRAYWEGADYLGVGPGAVSTLRGERSTTLADTAAYVKAVESGLDTRTNVEILSEEDLRIERIALLLRTREGIPMSLLSPSAGEREHDPVSSLTEQGLIQHRSDRLVLTEEGKALADPIAAALV